MRSKTLNIIRSVTGAFFLPLAVHIEVHHGVLQQVGLLALTGSSHTSIDSHWIHTWGEERERTKKRTY